MSVTWCLIMTNGIPVCIEIRFLIFANLKFVFAFHPDPSILFQLIYLTEKLTLGCMVCKELGSAACWCYVAPTSCKVKLGFVLCIMRLLDSKHQLCD